MNPRIQCRMIPEKVLTFPKQKYVRWIKLFVQTNVIKTVTSAKTIGFISYFPTVVWGVNRPKIKEEKHSQRQPPSKVR